MIFDTDILVWVERNHPAAVSIVQKDADRFISVWSYMELMQGAKNRHLQRLIAEYLREYDFVMLPLTESIGHRASGLVKEFSISRGLLAGDALIAATALEHDLTLCSANAKHFKPIEHLDLKIFKP